MKTCGHFARRWWLATAIAWLCCWSGGCGRRVEYVRGGHEVVPLERGQPAPEKGVWMSREYLSEIYEELGRVDAAKE